MKPNLIGVVFCLAGGLLLAADNSIDWEKARELRQRVMRGEKLSPEEKAYYEWALAARKQRGNGEAAAPGTWKAHLTPLTELGAGKYKGQDGGLYGGGQNKPPALHAEIAAREAGKIQPLDGEGNPSKSGKIVLLSVGMSNTTMEFSHFKGLADHDAGKSDAVVVVDGAQGGQTATIWADAKSKPWQEVERRLKNAGVTAEQVQAIWMKQAEARPAALGEFPAHAETLKTHLVTVMNLLKKNFPNLRVVYLSSRIYGGYAKTSLNPEPYAYESAFAVRWLIQDQINGKAELNCDASRGEVKSPLLLWGPYLWADGTSPGKDNGLIWEVKDLTDRDGTHPSESGRKKVAELLLKFFKTEPTARWFRRG
jgi:hypothetical protein